jgi:hypothetical protein
MEEGTLFAAVFIGFILGFSIAGMLLMANGC